MGWGAEQFAKALFELALVHAHGGAEIRNCQCTVHVASHQVAGALELVDVVGAEMRG